MQLGTRGYLDAVVYLVDLTHAVPPEQASRVARAMIGGRAYRDTPGTYLAAIEDALRDNGPIARDGEDEQHLRAFLTELRAQLEAARPWPEPAYRPLSNEEHRDLIQAPVMLRIEQRHREITTRLNAPFRPAGDNRMALVLALAGGPVVALTAPAQPGVFPVDVRATGAEPVAVHDALLAATGLDARPV